MAAASEGQQNFASSEIVIAEVRKFVKGSTYESKVSNQELVKSALFLLKTLPATRQAVLEHLCSVFDEAVNNHILKIELGNETTESTEQNLDTVINDVQDALMSFIIVNPTAWAPIISAWSIDLLGQMSSKYSDRRGVPHSSSLNELLQLWMTCSATKTLIEVASECFASMVGSAPDICVDALLEASVKHSPHFDWVVAHIGSCFPNTIINRVLMCGLKDFHVHGVSQGDGKPAIDENVPKMGSVVGILGHLASRHGSDIRRALLTLFKDCLEDNKDAMKISTVPFLLHLASMSPMLLKAVALDFVQALTPKVLNQLAVQMLKHLSGQEYNSQVNLVVHLIGNTDEGAFQLMQLLLDIGSPKAKADLHPSVQKTAAHIMDLFLLDLQRQVHKTPRDGPTDIAFLQSLQGHTNPLGLLLFESKGQRFHWIAKILSYISVYSGEGCAADILANIICQVTDIKQLESFILILDQAQIKHPDIMAAAVLKVVDQLQWNKNQLRILTNLVHLIRFERKKNDKKSLLAKVLENHLDALSTHLGNSDHTVAALTVLLLRLISLPPGVSVATLFKLTAGATSYFINTLHNTDLAIKSTGCRSCAKYIESLSKSCSMAQKMIFRHLLEGSICSSHAVLFGGNIKPQTKEKEIEQPELTVFQDNMNQGSAVPLPRSQSTVFHGGVIGEGLTPRIKPSPVSKDSQMHNKQLFLELLAACSNHDSGKQSTPDNAMEVDQSGSSDPLEIPASIAQALSLLVIELVTPDVMYNGIPWPEEESTKVTMERDLVISKRFEETPFIWDIMELLCNGPGAMGFCSVLLRANTAVMLAFWDSCREKAARNCPKQMETTCRVIHCMRKGKLLPPPLCYVGELFPLLSPFEVYLLLLNTWKYMKENPPVPDPQQQNKIVSKPCSSVYTEEICSIMHKNIDKLGHVYSRFCNNGNT